MGGEASEGKRRGWKRTEIAPTLISKKVDACTPT